MPPYCAARNPNHARLPRRHGALSLPASPRRSPHLPKSTSLASSTTRASANTRASSTTLSSAALVFFNVMMKMVQVPPGDVATPNMVIGDFLYQAGVGAAWGVGVALC